MQSKTSVTRVSSNIALLFAFLAISASATLPARAVDPYFVGTGIYPGGAIAVGMSSNGHFVVGNSTSVNDVVRWDREGDPIVLHIHAYPLGVSDDGSVIVGHTDTPLLPSAFRWTESGGVEYIAPGYAASEVRAVSNDGNTVIGGLSRYSNGYDGVFRWTTTGGLQPLGSIFPSGSRYFPGPVSPDCDVLIGRFSIPGDPTPHAFRWTEETGMVEVVGLATPPPGYLSVSLITSGTPDLSVLVGSLTVAQFVQVPARWTEATGWIALPDLEGGNTVTNGPVYATGVSADGSIVVGRGVDESGPEPFIWDAVHGTRNLTTVLRDEYGLAVGNLTQASHISDDGRTIVGWGSGEVWVAYLGPAAGDHNGNGTVDAADYVAWRKTNGALAGYDMWRAHFGEPGSGAGATAGLSSRADGVVPEPNTIILAAVVLAAVAIRWRTGPAMYP